MCTAISENAGRHLFGRTLDLEYSLSERVVITPRGFEMRFIHEQPQKRHLAIIGTAHVANSTPLYYDAANEAGLAAAALNFGESAVYLAPRPDTKNIASFELISWLLGQCKSVAEAADILKGITVTSEDFAPSLTSTPLHWMIADKERSIVVEPREHGLEIRDNPFGVMTNEPPLDYHLTNLKNYMSLDSAPPQNRIFPNVQIAPYSRGMGAIGLPGDFSSASRFVRAAFVKSHTRLDKNDDEITRFFHILDSVSVPRGCVITSEGKAVSTVYASCADTENATYYFTTHTDRSIRSLRLSDADVESSDLFSVSMQYMQ